MRFALCNEMFGEWPLERVLTRAGELGYDAVEVAPFTLADSVVQVAADRRKAIRDAALSAGVTVAGLHWLFVKPEGLYINHPDAEVRARTQQYLNELVDFCADLGGDRLVIGSPKQRSVCEGLSYAQAWAWAVETFRAALDRAEQRGVNLCIEPLASGATDFVTTVEEGKRMVDAVGHPRFRLHLDALAMRSEAKPLDELIRSAEGYVAHVHVNDAHKAVQGATATDYAAVARGLRDIGYDDLVSVEVFDTSPGAENIARDSLTLLRRVFA